MYKELLKLARYTISAKLDGNQVRVSDDIKDKYFKKQACFITLAKDKELRGCMGSLEPRQELWRDVVENSMHAAFNDPRFLPVSSDEMSKIKIEISILSVPEKLVYKDLKDLLRKIDNKMGIVLKKGGNSVTYLPQVWEHIPDKKEFLENLSMKAGLDKDDWKQGCEIKFYRVESVEE